MAKKKDQMRVFNTSSFFYLDLLSFKTRGGKYTVSWICIYCQPIFINGTYTDIIFISKDEERR